MPEYGAAVTPDGEREIGIVRSPCHSPGVRTQVIAMAAIDRESPAEDGERRAGGTRRRDGHGPTVAPLPLYDTEKRRPRA